MPNQPRIKKPAPLTPPNLAPEQLGVDRPDWRAWRQAQKRAQHERKEKRKRQYRSD